MSALSEGVADAADGGPDALQVQVLCEPDGGVLGEFSRSCNT
jgi:hypothetical protein